MGFGATILDADGLRLTPSEKAFFRDVDPFGFILFARNIDMPDQVQALCAELREAVGREALITVDQEGGRVQRLKPPLWHQWPAPLDFVIAAGDAAPRAIYVMYRLIAAELHRLGIDSNCAPMLDLARRETHPFLLNRCYGADVDRVVSLGRAVADGLADGGVLPVMKHMPGHGRGTMDTHFDLPHVSTPLEELTETDFATFRALRDLPLGMTAHLVFDAIDAQPATHSPAAIQVIREDIGFDNLLMTDDLSMKALSGTPGERTSAALAAGVDVALFCNAPLQERIEVAEAAGEMSAEAQARAERALAARKVPEEIDISALERELTALMGEAWHG